MSETPARPRASKLRILGDFHNRTILARSGRWIFTTYGVLVGLAFLVGTGVALWHDAALGLDLGVMAGFYLLVLVPLVIVGARAFSVLLEWRELFRAPLRTLIKPGYMLHGGVFGGAVAIAGFSAYTGNDALLIADSAAFAMPVGEAIARFGCLVYGCCWGKPTSGPVAIRYTSPHAKVVRCAPHLHGAKLHPAQIYGSLAHTALFAVFVFLLPHKAFDGMFAVLYLVAHPPLRVLLERFRKDDRGTLIGALTHTNLYSAVQVAAGLLLLALIAGNPAQTHLNAGAHLGDVLAVPGVALALGGISLLVALLFGVHRGAVGAWIDPNGEQTTVSAPVAAN
jgi:phosphatidylglycerol---prolipoprotein diacylglyceryl transferase